MDIITNVIEFLIIANLVCAVVVALASFFSDM